MVNKRKLVKCILIVIVLIALVSASIYTVFIKPKLSQDKYVYKEEEVLKGDLIIGIMESGNITLEESTLDYALELDTSDEDEDDEEETIKYLEIENVYVKSGQRIEEGEPLFKLTQESINGVTKKLNALYTEAQIAFAEAETEYEIELLEAKSTYDTSILESNKAKSSYDSSTTQIREGINILLAGNKVLEAEIVNCRKQLEDEELWESLEEANTAYTSAVNIYEETDVHNATAYTSNYTDYKSAKEQLNTIQNQMDELSQTIEDNQKKIARNKEEITALQSSLSVDSMTNESKYESDLLSGELAEDTYNYSIRSLEETVTAAQNDMEEAQSNVHTCNTFVGDNGIVYANRTGLVTSVSYGEGDDLINTGAMISYVKENNYVVTIDVSEEDISSITVGDTVDITFTAYGEEAYKGTVHSITTTATSDYATTISYPITIKIEGDTSLLYGGMASEVTFVTDSVYDVLYVSKKAVKEINGKEYVYIKGSTRSKKLTEVTTGFSDGTNIEIIDGLKQGDVVYIESKISGNEANIMESENKDIKPTQKDTMFENPDMPGAENNTGKEVE